MGLDLIDGARKELLEIIKRQGEVSVDEATEYLGLAKTTVRQHLLQLEHQGLIERRFEKAPVGRPQLKYCVSAKGEGLFPNREPALLQEFLSYLIANGQEKRIREFFEHYWKSRREQFEVTLAEVEAAHPSASSQKNRLEALRRLLEAEGFMPEAEISRDEKRIRLRECNCPFPAVIRATRLPCSLESEFIRWALKSPLRRSSYIPGGASACDYSTETK